MEEFAQQKQFLMQYREAVEKIADLHRQLERAESARMGISRQISGMPRAAPRTDRMADGLERVEQARRQLRGAYREARLARNRVMEAVCTVEGTERTVLLQRYIAGFTMQGIADSLHKSLRRVQQIHASALRKIRI